MSDDVTATPMNCAELAARSTSYSLGELAPGDAVRAREHLAGCADCADLVLRDRQLAGRLRAAAVPAPPAVHQAVRDDLERARRDRRSAGRRRLATRVTGLAVAAGLVAAVAVAANQDDEAAPPAPVASAPVRPASPLDAAWQVYAAPALPLEQRAAVSTAPDLTRAGLRAVGAGVVRLGTQKATAAEYVGDGGIRVTLFRWPGHLPSPSGAGYEGGAAGARPSVWTVKRGPTSSAWWDSDDVVWCVVGNLPSDRFATVVEHLRRTA
jgi:anti-sigma factor RsiW